MLKLQLESLILGSEQLEFPLLICLKTFGNLFRVTDWECSALFYQVMSNTKLDLLFGCLSVLLWHTCPLLVLLSQLLNSHESLVKLLLLFQHLLLSTIG